VGAASFSKQQHSHLTPALAITIAPPVAGPALLTPTPKGGRGGAGLAVAWGLRVAARRRYFGVALPEMHRTGRTQYEVAAQPGVACPICTYRWPLGAYWRVLVGRLMCEDHEHRLYRCQNCRHPMYDPKLVEGCPKGPYPPAAA
jgi:DNA-directed RNA polymerase subunit RPC12/RpoP